MEDIKNNLNPLEQGPQELGHRFGNLPEISNLPKLSSITQRPANTPDIPHDTRFGELNPPIPSQQINPLIPKKLSHRSSLYTISLISVMVILIAVFYFSNFYHGKPLLQLLGYQVEESPGQTAPAQYVPPAPRPTNPNPAPPAQYVPPAPAAPEPPFTPTATPAQYAQLESIIPTKEMIQKLPADAKINMIFFNRNRGYWEPEKYYQVSKASIVEGQFAEPDFKFVMNARWVPQFSEKSFCDVMQEARAASEADAEAFGSTISLTWKYKSIIGYRDCLGF